MNMFFKLLMIALTLGSNGVSSIEDTKSFLPEKTAINIAISELDIKSSEYDISLQRDSVYYYIDFMPIVDDENITLGGEVTVIIDAITGEIKQIIYKE